jgi:hypothetical protein
VRAHTRTPSGFRPSPDPAGNQPKGLVRYLYESGALLAHETAGPITGMRRARGRCFDGFIGADQRSLGLEMETVLDVVARGLHQGHAPARPLGCNSGSLNVGTCSPASAAAKQRST